MKTDWGRTNNVDLHRLEVQSDIRHRRKEKDRVENRGRDTK